jgi:hypothetical protein
MAESPKPSPTGPDHVEQEFAESLRQTAYVFKNEKDGRFRGSIAGASKVDQEDVACGPTPTRFEDRKYRRLSGGFSGIGALQRAPACRDRGFSFVMRVPRNVD